MTQNKNQNILHTWMLIMYVVMLNFFQNANSNGYILKGLTVNKYTNNSSKDHLLKLDLEFPKELRELRNDYPFDPDKIEMKKTCFLNIN